MPLPPEIIFRFERNLERSEELIKVYIQSVSGKGRKSVKQTDVLRAAVVFLHASLEDLLRSVLKYTYPINASKDFINEIPLTGIQKGGRPEKFFLGALLDFRGKLVDDVVKQSITEYLEVISFNDTTEIVSRLEKAKIKYLDDTLNLLPKIDSMIKRRHAIVHQADENVDTGHGKHHANRINKWIVSDWIENIRKFGEEIIRLASSI
ncbi:hypothetical protein CH364_18535 [Leptospira harrisiae]|uniref:RiboL-PSP-HEPN domain-containing protein n=1 Tax=Leptospira harrisiae TaxID=2023189 RepID=A0A2N0AFF9_9LEPT|nr:HEPN domain-containing protein [Leptospira harrisiae]PJZ82991.1 hypothetical protein CH364_18535 [Leptospira harrisiae]